MPKKTLPTKEQQLAAWTALFKKDDSIYALLNDVYSIEKLFEDAGTPQEKHVGWSITRNGKASYELELDEIDWTQFGWPEEYEVCSSKELKKAWEAVKNDADTCCVSVFNDKGDDFPYVSKVLEKGKLIGWRVHKEDRVFANLPANYDMTKYGMPSYLEEAGSLKRIAKEWEKIKKDPKAYYIAITDDDGLYASTYIHKILKDGKLAGWRVKEKGKSAVDLPADYDMSQFGFPGDSQELDCESLFMEIMLDMKSLTTPPLNAEELVKNPMFMAAIKRWEKEMLSNANAWLKGEG